MENNNCYYNIRETVENKEYHICTYPKPHRGWVGISGRCWDSKESCIFTQDGAQKTCSFYRIRD